MNQKTPKAQKKAYHQYNIKTKSKTNKQVKIVKQPYGNKTFKEKKTLEYTMKKVSNLKLSKQVKMIYFFRKRKKMIIQKKKLS